MAVEVSYDGTHSCPHPTCSRDVPKRMFACRAHWFQLTRPVQQAIYATATLHPLRPQRAEAISAAVQEWRGRLQADDQHHPPSLPAHDNPADNLDGNPADYER